MEYPGISTSRSSFASLGLFILVFVAGREASPQEAPRPPDAPRPQEAPGLAAPSLTLARVQDQIKKIEAATDLDEELKKKLLEAYQQAQGNLEKAEEYRASGAAFKLGIASDAKLAKEIREELEQAPPEIPEANVEVPAGATLKDLENELAKDRAELATAVDKRDKMESQLRERQGRPDRARGEQADARRRLEDIERAFRAEAPEGENPLLTEANRMALEARKILRTEQVSMLEQEILNHPMRIELLSAERDRAARKVAPLQARLKRFEEALNQRRRLEAEATERETQRARREAMGKHPAVRKLADENLKLSEELSRIVQEGNKATPEKQLKEAQKPQLQEVYNRTKVQLEQAGLSGVSGTVLWEQRKRLPEYLRDNRRIAAVWGARIPEAEARRFQINMDRRELTDLNRAVTRILETKVEATLPPEERQEIADQIRKFLTDRQGLLKTLGENYESYLKTLRDLDSSQKQLAQVARDFASLLDEWLLWIPSSSPPDSKFPVELGRAIVWVAAPRGWAEAGGRLRSDFGEQPVFPALVLLILVALIAGRRPMRARIHSIARNVGGVSTDNFALTLEALLWTLLLAAPVPLVIGFVGRRLSDEGSASATLFAPALGAGLVAVANLLFPLRFFQVLCQPRGVAEAHFRWRAASLKLLRRHFAWLLVVLPITAFVVALTKAQANDEVRDSLGRLAFLFGAGALAVFIQRVIRPKGGVTEHAVKRAPEGWLARLRYVWYPLAVAVPVCLLLAAVAGYYYTALELERLMIRTAWLVAGTVIVHHLALRWLVVEQRRLAVEKARQQREAEAQAAVAAGAAPEEAAEAPQAAPEVPEVDISTINEQTRQLLRTLAATAVVVGIWLIWSGVLPALAILEDVQLWSTQAVGETGTVTESITLEHLALAVIALVLTVAAAKNLPGLLEIAVLKNLPLEPGMRYALTTVSQYVVTVIGIVAMFNAIGIGWSKVQWLVAALSVGIGFGLQEIIANFFCGLILLFERPIRVGDIVTVGDTMGTVSKIRIRATTITNWDRMDLVIPNKELITGRLLNWTLSNTVNRIVVNVGIAYGSDTEKARQILLKVANEHPLIMKDPAPLATFESFGDSSLNLTLRCYLPDFANRLATIHELHSALNRELEEVGITIPFPQRDLHLKSSTVPLWQVERERQEVRSENELGA